jgi:hypothetical protein
MNDHRNNRLRILTSKNTKKTSDINRRFFIKVVPPGIEPGTQGFSVLCSTN